jgi:hypothetical protein
MGNDAMQEYDQEQRAAICYRTYRDRGKSIDTGTGLVAYDLQGQRKKEAAMIGGPKRLYGLIEKIEDIGDGTIKVHGIASTEDEDDQQEIVRAAAMRSAIPDYMRFGAVREMHGLQAAGRALECNCGNDNITRIVAHVVDPTAVLKVRNKVYNGFSIGGRVLEREAGNNKAITRLALHEISLVDRPANPSATIDLWKLGGNSVADDKCMSGDAPKMVAPTGLPKGFNSMETAFAQALAKTQQFWRCDNPSHMHVKKEEAAQCMAKSAATDALKGREPFSEKDARFRDPALAGHVDTEKHGLPDTPAINPGEPPGDGAKEENFDGDDDADDSRSSAESAGGGFSPEGDEDRRSDFGKKANGSDNGKKPYGDVRYADPGYQSDGKKRYPVDNEKHVRAAWSYINQADNARAYSSEQLGRVKARIRSAAKEHGIEISGKAIFDLGDPEALLKSLPEAALNALLEELPYDDGFVLEKAGRRQSAADTFMKNMVHDAIGKLTDGEFCQKIDNATQDTGRNSEHSAPDQGTDSGTAHYRLGDNATQDTAKRGARHSAMTVGFLRKAHDNICKAGAYCPAHEGMNKSLTTEGIEMTANSSTALDEGLDAATLELLRSARKDNKKLHKAIAEQAREIAVMKTHIEYMGKEAGTPPPPPAPLPEKEPKLKKQFAAQAELLTAMAARIEQIASTPIPGSASHLPAGIINVSKAQDGGQGQAATVQQVAAAEGLEKQWAKMTPEQKFKASWMISHMKPYGQQR